MLLHHPQVLAAAAALQLSPAVFLLAYAWSRGYPNLCKWTNPVHLQEVMDAFNDSGRCSGRCSHGDNGGDKCMAVLREFKIVGTGESGSFDSCGGDEEVTDTHFCWDPGVIE